MNYAQLQAAKNDANIHEIPVEALVALQATGLSPEAALIAVLQARRTVFDIERNHEAEKELSPEDRQLVDLQRTRYQRLWDETMAIRTVGVGDSIAHILNEARDNADLTVLREKAAPASDWRRVFEGSIGSLLSSGDYSRHVIAWFDRRGIRG